MSGRPWFVPRSVGIGWRPATWQGWVITAVLVVLVAATVVFFRVRRSPIAIVALVPVIGAYVLVAATASRRRATTPPPQGRAAADAPSPSDAGAAAPAAPPPAPLPPPAARADVTAPAKQPALVVERLTKRFGERVAFQDVSFTVGAGEVFGFLGPNGAGKTTTVRTLGTLIAPTAGSATVVGIPLEPQNGEAIRRRIAIMPEAPGLYQRLSVRENLEFFAGLFGVADSRTRIHDALESVNMAARANDVCGSLSKGLRQRVALARALLSDPDVLFLDEPTSGLDPVATREVHGLIDDLRRRGVTIFLTTHRLEEAERLCDRVAILNTTLRMVGRPDELRARLFSKSLIVELAAALGDPKRVFDAVDGVERWDSDAAGRYTLTVSDPKAVAPRVTRALVAAGADVRSIAERQHSLEDVYLELISEDVEAAGR